MGTVKLAVGFDDRGYAVTSNYISCRWFCYFRNEDDVLRDASGDNGHPRYGKAGFPVNQHKSGGE